MFGLGTTELIIIGVIILLIFGAKRIPEIGKGLGGALREFRNIKKELRGSDKKNSDDKEVDKVLEQVPGMKKVMDINEKVKKVKEVIK